MTQTPIKFDYEYTYSEAEAFLGTEMKVTLYHRNGQGPLRINLGTY